MPFATRSVGSLRSHVARVLSLASRLSATVAAPHRRGAAKGEEDQWRASCRASFDEEAPNQVGDVAGSRSFY